MQPQPLEEHEKITLEAMRKVMPANRKVIVTQHMVDELNAVMGDEMLRENFRENVLSYTRVLADPKYRISDYINAVKFVSFRLLGDSPNEAYTKTFPMRFQRLIDNGLSATKISNFVGAYNRTQLVNLILEQAMVPHHVLNQGLFQKALNVQADLMMNAKSEKVKTDAANSLLNHLKMPETSKVELDVTVKEDDTIGELRKSTLELVQQQRKMIQAGVMNARQVAEQKIIGEVVSDQ